jgi:AcrR family transcriptional regulator
LQFKRLFNTIQVVFNLTMPSSPPKRKPAPVVESVRESLLSAGRKLFAEKGFDGVSVKDLANATGHNAALVNYYFHSKEGLYRECVKPLLTAGAPFAECTLRPAVCRQDFITRFELFVEQLITSHMEQQDLCVILHRDLHTEVVRQLFKDHVLGLCDRLRAFFECAKKQKYLRSDLSPELLTKIVSSCLFHLITMDRFRQELNEPRLLDNKHRAETIRQMTTLLLYGLTAPTSH